MTEQAKLTREQIEAWRKWYYANPHHAGGNFNVLCDMAIRALEASERQALTWIEINALLELGMAEYKQRHPKWWKRMDGTPILNDLPVVLADALCREKLYAAPPAAVAGQSGFVTVPRKCTPIIVE